MNKGFITTAALSLVGLALLGGVAFFATRQSKADDTLGAAPISSSQRNINPFVDSEYYLGTTTPSTLAWKGLIVDEICLGGDCQTSFPGAGGGEANTGANRGTGVPIFDSKSGVVLRFNSIAAGSNVTVSTSSDANTLVISSTGGGGTFPFTPSAYGVSTSTTLGFLNGFLSTASSTINASTTVTGVLTASGGIFGNVTGSLTGNASTASNLAADPADCSTGSFTVGINAAGAAQDCTDAWTEAENTSADYQTVAEVTAFIHASSTIPKTYTGNTFTGLQAFTNTGTTSFTGGLSALRLNATASSTLAGLVVGTGGLQVPTLPNCNTVDTDASGNFICGSDATGAGGTGLATSTEIADNQVIVGTSAGDVGSYNTFTFDNSTNVLNVNGFIDVSDWRVATSTTVCAVGCEYTTIQNAIAANWRYIRVKDGTYSEALSILNSKTTLEFESLNAILSCNSTTQPVCISATSTSEITIKGGTVREVNARTAGIGLDWSDTSLMRVQGTRFNNFATSTYAHDSASTNFYGHFENVLMFEPRSCIDIGGTQANNNTFEVSRCRPMAIDGGVAVYVSDSRAVNFDNMNVEGTTTARSNIGYYFDATSRDNFVSGGWVEAIGTNVFIASGANNTSFVGTTITSGGTDITDNGTNSTFLAVNRTGTKLFTLPFLTLTGLLTQSGSGTSTFVSSIDSAADIEADQFFASGSTGTSTLAGLILSNGLTMTGVATGCATFTSGVLSSTGVACGSGSGGGANSKWATSTDTTSIFTANATKVGIGTSSPYAALSVVGEAVATHFTATTTTATSTLPNLSVTNLLIGGESFADLSGNGLGFSAGSLTATLGTTIAPNELVGQAALKPDLIVALNSAGTGFAATGTPQLTIGNLVSTTTATSTLAGNLTVTRTTVPQLTLSDGVGFPWAFRSVGNNLYLATTTLATGATSSPAALEIRGNVATNVGIGTSTPTSLGNNVMATHGSLFVGRKDGVTLANSTSTFDGNIRAFGVVQAGAGSAYLTNDGMNTSDGQIVLSSAGTSHINGPLVLAGLEDDQTAGLAGIMCLDGSNHIKKLSGLGTCVVSSLRFKDNVKDLPKSEALLGLNPVQFEYKETPGVTRYGLIAEEVEKVDPNLVHYGTDGLPYTVHYEAIVSLLVQKVQDQQKQIDALETPQTKRDPLPYVMILLLIGYMVYARFR